MSKPTKTELKHAHISLAVLMGLLIVNAILFHGSEDAMAAGGAVAFIACFGVFFFLDIRESRSRGSAAKRSR